MSADSKRKRAIAAMVARLQTITTDNGCTTDAGEHVFIGENPTLGPDDAEAVLAIIVQPVVPSFQNERILERLPLEIQVLAPAGSVPYESMEDALADVKRAIELREEDLAGSDARRFGTSVQRDGIERGVTQIAERPEGSQYAGLSITYTLLIREGWGTP
jgi:hypothetical protein